MKFSITLICGFLNCICDFVITKFCSLKTNDLRVAFSVLILLLIHSECKSQGEYNNWYFGINSGMTFTPTGIKVINDSKTYNNEGAASISDSAGNLLFYLGLEVRDRNNNKMPNDTNISYNPTVEQSFLIIPKPDDPNIYYYLLITGKNGNQYKRNLLVHVIDMRKNGGLGDIISKNDTLLKNTTEQMTATRHRNGKDFWIVTHSYASNEFYSFLLTKNGISKTPVISPTGFNLNSKVYAFAGNIKISPNGCWLAAINRENPPILQLLHFDNCSGKVSGNSYKRVYAPWGIEFSPNSNYLYLGSNSTKPIVQFDLNGASDSLILTSEKICSDTLLCSFDFQIGPDNKIYISCLAKDYATKSTDGKMHYLGVINLPDKLGTACSFKMDTSHYFNHIMSGLPNNFNLLNKNLTNCIKCSVTAKKEMTICNEDSIFFSKKYIKTSGIYIGETVHIPCRCDSVVQLNLNVKKTEATKINKSICSMDSFRFFNVSITKPGIYRHSIKSASGCDSLIILDLSVNPKPDITKIADSIICENDSLNFDFSSYELTKIFLNDKTIGSNFWVKPNQDYILQFIDSNNCINKDTFNVFFGNCDSNYLKISNVFTPGSDGFNDNFDIIIEGEIYYNLKIFNRWGQLVYDQNKDEDTQSNNNWNGRLNNTGNSCPEGTYFYIFEYRFKNKEIKIVNGLISLIR